MNQTTPKSSIKQHKHTLVFHFIDIYTCTNTTQTQQQQNNIKHKTNAKNTIIPNKSNIIHIKINQNTYSHYVAAKINKKYSKCIEIQKWYHHTSTRHIEQKAQPSNQQHNVIYRTRSHNASDIYKFTNHKSTAQCQLSDPFP